MSGLQQTADSDYIQVEMGRLNPEQRKAVEALDGPVLVVAGPGTGKTQLLSLRTVNLLAKRDIQPRDILCLTFTDAGAEAMTKRLTRFIGRDAYEVNVFTFHSFASRIRMEYPAHFSHGAFSTLITQIQASRKLSELLHELEYTNPLAQNIPAGRHGQLASIKSFISVLRKSGLSVGQFRAICQQNLAFFSFVADKTDILGRLASPTGTSAQKAEQLDRLAADVNALAAVVPVELQERLVSTPGTYEPYAQYLAARFANTDLYENNGKSTKGLQDLRRDLFEKHDEAFAFKDARICEQALVALEIYEKYQAFMDENDFYDFDDMILDAIAAIESSPSLKAELQDRFKYIQVDEFQDTNGAQMRLVELLTDNSQNPNLLVVGDDDQAIYRFQGASVRYIQEFEDAYPQVLRCVLKTNYRSTPALVALGQEVVKQIEYRSEASATEKQLVAYNAETSTPQPVVKAYPTAELQYSAVAHSIKQRIDSGFVRNSKKPDEAIAVIARGHKTLKGLIPYLKAQGVPFRYVFTTNLANIASMQTLLALINYLGLHTQALMAHAEVYLPQVLASPEFAFTAEQRIRLALEAKNLKLPPDKRQTRWLEALKASTDPDYVRFYAWLMDMADAAAAKPVRQVILNLAEPLRKHYERLSSDDPYIYAEFNYGVKALIAFFEDEASVVMRGLEDRPLCLYDLTRLFEEAKTYEVVVEVGIPVSRDEAVTLTTAHGSKGLEYDAVYLVDADNDSWHSRGRGGSGFYAHNVEFRDDGLESADDDCRLVFVALTRARHELEISRAGKGTMSELVGTLAEEEFTPDITEIIQQSESVWQDAYRLDSAELQALIRPDLEKLVLSVSTLNKFVEYKAQCANSTDFVADSILRFPFEPNIYLALGNVFHAFVEEYLNHVWVKGDTTMEALAQRAREEIACMDFEASDKEHMLQRFDQIVRRFMPQIGGYLTGPLNVERSINVDFDGIPLYAKCDLLVRDEANRTIQLFDFKTNSRLPEKADLNYLRQLQFYRLVIEASRDFMGWKVISQADLYVQPMKALGYELAPPVSYRVKDEELEHLKLLIKAVWWRIQNELFDTTAFEQSELYEAVRPSGYKADGSLLAKDAQPVQQAYEQWLIEQWQAHVISE